MNDLISVIVPVYNVEKYLNKCIESIVNQSYTNLEIILVDDGSPDNCPVICDEWAKKDNRIKVIHKSNGGLSDARNAGLAIATGEYIAFVDSDDYLNCDMYKNLIQVIFDTNCDIAVCNLIMVYEDNINSCDVTDSMTVTRYSTIEAMSALIDDKIRQVVWNKLYKLEIIKDILFDVGKYHEDEFWSYKAIGSAKQVATIEYTGYYYLQRAGSIMGNDYSLKRLNAVEAKCLRQYYLNRYFPDLVQKGLINLIFTCIYHGQLSLTCLKQTEKNIAIKKLENIFRNNINDLSINSLPIKQKIWICIAKISFNFVCKIRNFLSIGI